MTDFTLIIDNLPFFLQCLWRWHPQVALRYLPIVDEIRRMQSYGKTTRQGISSRRFPFRTKVLEVGSGSLGIAPYLRQEVTGVDISFSEPSFPLLKQVRGDATNLPFPDQSFDFVLSVDMLEHLPVDKRILAISEAIRVAKRGVFLAIPCGKKAQYQDRKHNQKYKQIFGKFYPYLEEQVKYGLPREKEIVKCVEKSTERLKRNVEIKVKGNLNLNVRNLLMNGWMTKSLVVDILFRKVFLIFIPILRYCNWEPTYRKIFFIMLK